MESSPIKEAIVRTRVIGSGTVEAKPAAPAELRVGKDGRKYPPMSEQVRNALAAAGRAGVKVVRGERLMRSEDERAAFEKICKGDGVTLPCDWWDKDKPRCKKCGCFGNWKRRLTSEKCPLGKWG